ncbi:Uncharacterized protein OBRU01_02056 [Operophtera brumata]|uniref:Uncharacterized protein n=1 Tax=Operophtera brumata TaxID=104452 RepID=A0A0L7LT55_OPEBR|nr:Uncharacterized protein OBRU01_02056 [Operophtera brumata]
MRLILAALIFYLEKNISAISFFASDLRLQVKNIPDVSAAEEKELMSAESSPTSSRFSEASTQSNCDSRAHTTPPQTSRERDLKRAVSADTETPNKSFKIEHLALSAPIKTEPYFPIIHSDPSSIMPEAIDLSKRPVRTANFYQETLVTEEVEHKSVIKLNPTYSSPQPSTSYTNPNPVPALRKIEIPVPKPSFERHNSIHRTPVTPRAPVTPRTPITPIINIDFTKSLSVPEIKVLDATAVPPKVKQVIRQNSKPKMDVRKAEVKPSPQPVKVPVDIDSLNSGNLQIDEDYDT